MTKIVLCSAAERDYTESLCWYSEHSLEAARHFEADIEDALAQIATDPGRFPRCDNKHQFYLMRRFPFQIIYRIQELSIVIIAIAHASRSPDFWTDR